MHPPQHYRIIHCQQVTYTDISTTFMPKQPSLVLGSSSPFRRELLERLMVNFVTDSPNIDESAQPNESPIALVERLAVEKALAVAKRHTNALIIGSDQVALHNNQVVGKPGAHDAAVKQLRQASGKSVTLYTGIALVNTESGRIQSDVVKFVTHFKSLSDATIERYLRKEQPYDCAGSLKSEGLGIALLSRFEGDDPSALIGLPLIRLIAMLESEHFELF